MTLAIEKFNRRATAQLTLPKEHGSWSLALEPVAFGLLVAPSAAGAALTLADWLASLRLMPWAAAGFALVFAVRTVWLLLGRPRLTAMKLGITEAVLGALMVLVLSAAWRSAGG